MNEIENKELKIESPKLEICRMTITSKKEVILLIKLLKSGNLHKLIIVSAFIHVWYFKTSYFTKKLHKKGLYLSYLMI